jgi:predicted nucleic acid-binding protein
MAGRFLDSSAVAKFYHPELGSGAVEQIVQDPAASILISRLSVVEIQSVFAGKIRSGVISAGDAADLRRRFFEDVASGLFRIVALSSEHYEIAGQLIEAYGATHGLRTLDSLQLAVALSLSRAGAVEDFVVADKILNKVAAIEGLSVTDPESAPL